MVKKYKDTLIHFDRTRERTDGHTHTHTDRTTAYSATTLASLSNIEKRVHANFNLELTLLTTY